MIVWTGAWAGPLAHDSKKDDLLARLAEEEDEGMDATPAAANGAKTDDQVHSLFAIQDCD